MKPVDVWIEVPQPRQEVFAFLDVLANHEPFTNHMLVDWSCSGPSAGVGARARMRAKGPGKQWLDMSTIISEPPVTTTEESVGAGGRRRTRGTYTLDELPDGGTRVRFRLAFLEVPLSERLVGPLIRAYMKRVNAEAMRRLKQTLTALPRTTAR